MTRLPRIALTALAGTVAAAVIAGGIVIARFDPNSLKPDIIQQVKRATGRDLTLDGPVNLKASLWPTIELHDVAISNPPGFSRPQMGTLRALEVQIALLPLLSSRIEINRLVLTRPDIRLETTTAGDTNWVIARMDAGESPVETRSTTGTPSPVAAQQSVGVRQVEIYDGTITVLNGRTGITRTIAVRTLDAEADGPDSPVHLQTDAAYDGSAFSLTADTGSLVRLLDKTAETAWPVKLALKAAGAKVTADGALTRPLFGKGFDLAVTAVIPDLSALAPLLPGASLPALRDMRFAGRVADRGGRIPAVSGLTLHAGTSDLSGLVPGLHLDRLDVAAAELDQPMRAEADGSLGDQPLSLTAVLGKPAQLLPDAPVEPFPVDIAARAEGASASIQGSIANARALTGLDLALAADVPDLGVLSRLARRPLPALKDIVLRTTVTDATRGQGFALDNLRLTAADGDLSGQAAVILAPRPALTATLSAGRIDLDALRKAARPLPDTPSAPASAAEHAPATEHRRTGRIFPDDPLPFAHLLGVDADLRLTIGTLRNGGADTRDAEAHIVLNGGRLVVDPFQAQLPQGRLQGRLTADANRPVPPVHLSFHAPGLSLRMLLADLGQPPFATGDLAVHADLDGAGTTPHALAASLNGSAGLAVAGGTLDNRLIGGVLGQIIAQFNLLNLVGRGGASDLRCFATRLDIRDGIASVRSLALSSTLLTLNGGGTINLGDETLALILNPQARIAGAPVAIPVRVTGPIRNPSTSISPVGSAEATAGSVAGVVTNPLGVLSGLLGTDKVLGINIAGADACPSALAAARGESAPEPSRPALSGPPSALRSLFR